jgi:hypothetical protein
MKCSRVALSLLLAAFVGAVIALGPTEGRGTSAVDFGPQPPPCMDSLGYENQYQGATDWRDIDAAEPHYGEYRQEEQEEHASTHEAYRSNFEGEEQNLTPANDSSVMTPDGSGTTDGTTDSATAGTTDNSATAAGDDSASNGMDGSDSGAIEEATDEAGTEAEEEADDDASHHYGYEPVQSPYGYENYRYVPSGDDYSNQYKYSNPTEKYGYSDDAAEADTATQQSEAPQADSAEYDYTYDDFRVGDSDFVPYVPTDVAVEESMDTESSDNESGNADTFVPADNSSESFGSESENGGTYMPGTESGESFNAEAGNSDASTPTDNSSESSGSASENGGTYMPGTESGESFGAESGNSSDASAPSDNSNESFGSETESSNAYIPGMDASESFGTESGNSTYAPTEENSASYESGSESGETSTYESGMNYSGDNRESGNESAASVSDDPCMGVYYPTQGRSVLDIAKAWSERWLSNYDGAIRNISLPMAWLELPSLVNFGRDDRTAADSTFTGGQTSF